MSTQRRVIDASKGWQPLVNTQGNQPQVRSQPQAPYVPKQVIRQPSQQRIPQVSGHINPHANIVYPNAYPQQIPVSQPVQQVQQPVSQPEPQVQISTPSTHKAQPVASEQQRANPPHDLGMKGFDTTGCKTINDAYTRNSNKIKIILE